MPAAVSSVFDPTVLEKLHVGPEILFDLFLDSKLHANI